jgi:SAM-dependent methyltransferase
VTSDGAVGHLLRFGLLRGLHLLDEGADLGAGALNDTKYLLEEGFQKVIAIDREPSVKELGQEINSEKLEIVISSFESFEFPENTFDLINAQYSLPFIPPESFNEVFKKIKSSLKTGGIFVGQLFGERDEWRDNPLMTFHTSEEVKGLLSGVEVIDLREEEKDGETASGVLPARRRRELRHDLLGSPRPRERLRQAEHREDPRLRRRVRRVAGTVTDLDKGELGHIGAGSDA